MLWQLRHFPARMWGLLKRKTIKYNLQSIMNRLLKRHKTQQKRLTFPSPFTRQANVKKRPCRLVALTEPLQLGFNLTVVAPRRLRYDNSFVNKRGKTHLGCCKAQNRLRVAQSPSCSVSFIGYSCTHSAPLRGKRRMRAQKTGGCCHRRVSIATRAAVWGCALNVVWQAVGGAKHALHLLLHTHAQFWPYVLVGKWRPTPSSGYFSFWDLKRP